MCTGIESRNHKKKKLRLYICLQCCGAGAGGAEIILEPGAGAENKFSAVSLEDARMKKSSLLPLLE